MKNKLHLMSFLLKVITTFFTITTTTNIKNENLIMFLILILISLFYYKNETKEKIDKKNKKYYILFSFLISFSQILGSIIYKYQFSREVSALREFINIKTIINIIGLFFIFYTLLVTYVPKLLKINILQREKKYSRLKLFAIAFIVIFICWIPYFLALYPGILTADSISQFSSFVNGFNIVSDHHPVIHTVFMGITYKIGYFIFHSVNAATSFVSIAQMMFMASIFSYLCVWLYKKMFQKLF